MPDGLLKPTYAQFASAEHWRSLNLVRNLLDPLGHGCVYVDDPLDVAEVDMSPEHIRNRSSCTRYMFSPGICWSGFKVNRSGSFVHILQMYS